MDSAPWVMQEVANLRWVSQTTATTGQRRPPLPRLVEQLSALVQLQRHLSFLALLGLLIYGGIVNRLLSADDRNVLMLATLVLLCRREVLGHLFGRRLRS